MKTVGTGPDVALIHGSATDRSTWAIQLATLSRAFRLHAPTRPGASGEVVAIADQAAGLLAGLEKRDVGSFIAVGSSFGSIACLEMALQRPDRVRGLVLIEPPMAASDAVAAVPLSFGCRFDAICAAQGGEAAAEMFLRLVLGDDVFEKIPAAFRARSVASWRHIRADSVALSRYRPRYERLREMTVPTLLVGGGKSPPLYGETLEALAATLPNARLEVIEGAGHMLHAEAPQRFGELLAEFASAL